MKITLAERDGKGGEEKILLRMETLIQLRLRSGYDRVINGNQGKGRGDYGYSKTSRFEDRP